MLLKGKNALIYGNVQFYPNIIVEDNVVIGHPSASELKDCLLHLDEYKSVEELYSDKKVRISRLLEVTR